jgi:adenine-specific DNA methylase
MTINSDKLPLDLMDEFAERESYSRHHYRPIYSMHKWWARRPGSTFRILSLAALTDDDVTKDDILRRNDSGSYDGLYLDHDEYDFSDEVVLDPFTGGGTPLIEANRVGAQTIGYELNPVAWFVTKKSVDEVDLDELKSKYDEVISDVREEVGEYFATTDPETGREGEILYTFLCQTLPCLTCGEETRLFPRYKLAEERSTAPAALYCPNPDCDDRLITLDREIKDEETCPACDTTFDPTDGNTGRGKYTCSNGHKHDIKETLQRLDEKPTFDYFAIQFADDGGNKKYKTPDEDDRENIAEIKRRREQEGDEWLIPTQSIPDGDKTTALKNYNYERFDELFTPRQLFAFSTLFERAKQVDDDNLSEFLILAISNALRFNSKLCTWDYRRQLGVNVFKRHAYVPRAQPIEANPINERGGRTSVDNFFDSIIKGKEYAQNPFEKVKNNVTGETKNHDIRNESVSSDRLLDLRCQTAERLEEDDESVDYVITDPPYYDNVQYSELADYFYVWLHKCLGDEIDEFSPELAPKGREIVANKNAGKDDEFFINGLSNVFSECHRVLTEDGELVFTYHHTESEAWSVILRAILDSGFTITGAYPVQSERSNNPHIGDLDNTEYDIILTANKEEVDEETTLPELRQTLYFDVQEWLEEERQLHRNMSIGDLGVILRGRCLYHFSKHYPDIFHEGEQVSVEKALETADEVITQVLESVVDLPPSIDVVTRAYVGHLNRVNESMGSETFDDLRKHLMPHNLNVSDLEDEQLVEGPRTEKQPVGPDQRIYHIEHKLNRNGDVLAIDKVHYLYHLFTTDQDVAEYLRRWKDDDLEQLADKMEEITGDGAYSQMMNLTLSSY